VRVPSIFHLTLPFTHTHAKGVVQENIVTESNLIAKPNIIMFVFNPNEKTGNKKYRTLQTTAKV
jgi:hypothetical protein